MLTRFSQRKKETITHKENDRTPFHAVNALYRVRTGRELFSVHGFHITNVVYYQYY